MPYGDTILPVMRELRDMLKPQWGNVSSRSKEDQWQSVVTDADMQAERHLATRLEALYPDIAFVGEEGGGPRDAARLWLVDPIDGTRHFVDGEHGCTSMLALVVDGSVEFSAIYDFVEDTMYWAEKGKGAFCEETPIHVRTGTDLGTARIICEINLEKNDNHRLFSELGTVTHAERSRVAGWEFVQVARGEYDARICKDSYGYDYDFAPGTFLVAEAGGTVVNLGSPSYDYRITDLYAGNPNLASHLSSISSFPTASLPSLQ